MRLPSNSDELFAYTQKFINDGFDELDDYYLVIDEDLLSTGISRFQLKARQAREWGNRILKLMQDARRLKSPVLSQTQGVSRLHDAHLAQWVQQNRQTDTCKGLDGNERKALARANWTEEACRVDQWTVISGELRDFIETCRLKHKDMVQARDDLKAQLWAVRIQAISGEGKAKNTYLVKDPQLDGEDLNLGGKSNELDELLEGGD